jgi:hypothetical protein
MNDYNCVSQRRRKDEGNGKFSSLGSEFEQFMTAHEQDVTLKARGLQLAWEGVAQERVLEHTDNVVYSKRSAKTELLIYVDDPSWAAELTMNKEAYRLLMQKQLNKPIADIKFLVSRGAAFRKRQ